MLTGSTQKVPLSKEMTFVVTKFVLTLVCPFPIAVHDGAGGLHVPAEGACGAGLKEGAGRALLHRGGGLVRSAQVRAYADRA